MNYNLWIRFSTLKTKKATDLLFKNNIKFLLSSDGLVKFDNLSDYNMAMITFANADISIFKYGEDE